MERRSVSWSCRAYLVHLGLGGLLQRVQDDVQVLLKLSSDGQSDVSERREDLRLHRTVDVLVLKTQGGRRNDPGSTEHRSQFTRKKTQQVLMRLNWFPQVSDKRGGFTSRSEWCMVYHHRPKPRRVLVLLTPRFSRRSCMISSQ